MALHSVSCIVHSYLNQSQNHKSHVIRECYSRRVWFLKVWNLFVCKLRILFTCSVSSVRRSDEKGQLWSLISVPVSSKARKGWWYTCDRTANDSHTGGWSHHLQKHQQSDKNVFMQNKHTLTTSTTRKGCYDVIFKNTGIMFYQRERLNLRQSNWKTKF